MPKFTKWHMLRPHSLYTCKHVPTETCIVSCLHVVTSTACLPVRAMFTATQGMLGGLKRCAFSLSLSLYPFAP